MDAAVVGTTTSKAAKLVLVNVATKVELVKYWTVPNARVGVRVAEAPAPETEIV